MTDIKTLQTWELESDLYASLLDVVVCCHALQLGVNEVFGASVIERLDDNLAMYHKIHAELVVRGVVHATMELDCRELRARPAMAGWQPQYAARNVEIDQWANKTNDPIARLRAGSV